MVLYHSQVTVSMISVKYAIIMAVAAFAAGSIFASPVPQAIAAIIATDVQCTGCVGTSDLAGNAVTAAKIKDSEVKAAEIAANAVGASEIATDAVGATEIQGVTKLIFQKYTLTNAQATRVIGPNDLIAVPFFLPGIAPGDNFIATFNDVSGAASCTVVAGQFIVSADQAGVALDNICDVAGPPGAGAYISIIVFANNFT